MATKSALTPVRVPVRRNDGTVGSAIRFKNLVPRPGGNTPAAGPKSGGYSMPPELRAKLLASPIALRALTGTGEAEPAGF